MNRTLTMTLLGLMWTIVACGVEETLSSTNKIIGENDLTPVGQEGTNLPESLRSLPSAIGMLAAGCTVTHIGDGLVLTAGHCVPQNVKFPDECLSRKFPSMTIRWNYREGAEPTADSVCLKVLASELSQSHDFALLKVDNAPSASVRVELNERPAAGQQITILAHPRKRPLEWSQFCRLAVLPSDFMPDLTTQDRKTIFAHQCDTEQGSSGAAIFDTTSLKVIGIHHGGVDPWNTATWVTTSAVSRAIRAARNPGPRR